MANTGGKDRKDEKRQGNRSWGMLSFFLALVLVLQAFLPPVTANAASGVKLKQAKVTLSAGSTL